MYIRPHNKVNDVCIYTYTYVVHTIVRLRTTTTTTAIYYYRVVAERPHHMSAFRLTDHSNAYFTHDHIPSHSPLARRSPTWPCYIYGGLCGCVCVCARHSDNAVSIVCGPDNICDHSYIEIHLFLQCYIYIYIKRTRTTITHNVFTIYMSVETGRRKHRERERQRTYIENGFHSHRRLYHKSCHLALGVAHFSVRWIVGGGGSPTGKCIEKSEP